MLTTDQNFFSSLFLVPAVSVAAVSGALAMRIILRINYSFPHVSTTLQQRPIIAPNWRILSTTSLKWPNCPQEALLCYSWELLSACIPLYASKFTASRTKTFVKLWCGLKGLSFSSTTTKSKSTVVVGQSFWICISNYLGEVFWTTSTMAFTSHCRLLLFTSPTNLSNLYLLNRISRV